MGTLASGDDLRRLTDTDEGTMNTWKREKEDSRRDLGSLVHDSDCDAAQHAYEDGMK